jgi:hypothetical protein
VVSAVATYSKLNANGQWIDRRETIDLNELFTRMTEDELRRYASTGKLPAWFNSVVGATAIDSHPICYNNLSGHSASLPRGHVADQCVYCGRRPKPSS